MRTGQADLGTPEQDLHFNRDKALGLLVVLIFRFLRDLWICFKEELLDSF